MRKEIDFYKRLLYNTKKRNMKQIIILAIGIILNIPTFAQKNNISEAKLRNFESRINDIACDVSKSIDKNTGEQLKLLIRKSLIEYYEFSILKDKQNGIVTQESVTKFNELFDDNAKVVSDISRYNGIVVSSESYSSSIFDYLTAVGVDFEITSAVLDKIRLDKAGYYKADVLITKIIFNGLDNDNSQFRCKSGRKYDLVISYRIDTDNLTKAYISNISGTLIKDCEDAKPKWGYYIGGDYSSIKADKTDYFNTNLNTLNLSINPSYSACFGAYYLKPLTIKEKTFFKVGLQIGYTNLKTTIDPSSYTILNDNHSINGSKVSLSNPSSTTYSSFDRKITIDKQFAESHHTFNIAIPLGIHQIINTNNNETFRFSVDAMIIPTFLVYSSTKWSGRLDYTGIFNFYNNNSVIVPSQDSIGGKGVDEIEAEAFGLKKNNFFQNSDKSEISSGHKLEKPDQVKLKFHPSIIVALSPNLEFILSKEMSFVVSPTISYTINSFVKSEESNKPIFAGTPIINGSVQDRVNQGIKSTVVEDYFSSVKLLSFGLRVGLLYNLK